MSVSKKNVRNNKKKLFFFTLAQIALLKTIKNVKKNVDEHRNCC